MASSMALTLAGFCFSVIFIVFVCSRLACALIRRRRARSRRALPHFAATAGGYPFAANLAAAGGGAGLDPAAVAAFPTCAFAGPGCGSPSDADAQCVICLAEYREKDLLRFLPYCGHNFHMTCINMWLEQNSTCPVCRISLRGSPDTEHIVLPPLPSVVISPPCSPPPSRSDPCNCLLVSTGHSSRASEVLRHEADQDSQVASGPSADVVSNLSLSEVSSPRENNSQAVRKQVERSSQLGPCK